MIVISLGRYNIHSCISWKKISVNCSLHLEDGRLFEEIKSLKIDKWIVEIDDNYQLFMLEDPMEKKREMRKEYEIYLSSNIDNCPNTYIENMKKSLKCHEKNGGRIIVFDFI